MIIVVLSEVLTMFLEQIFPDSFQWDFSSLGYEINSFDFQVF
jgi:hypothetical protein